MARYIIVGASIETGADVRVTLEAATPMAAAEQAQAMRIAVSQIDIEPPRASVPPPPPPPPPMQTARPQHMSASLTRPLAAGSGGVAGAAAQGFSGAIGAIAGICFVAVVCCLGCLGWIADSRSSRQSASSARPASVGVPAPDPPRSEWAEPDGKLKAKLKVCNEEFRHTKLVAGGQPLWPDLVVRSAVIDGDSMRPGDKDRVVGVLIEFEWKGAAFARNVFRAAIEDANGKTIASSDMCSHVRFAPGTHKFADQVFVPVGMDTASMVPVLWVW